MINAIQNIGRNTLDTLAGLGRALIMLLGAVFSVPNFRKGTPLLLKQLYMVGFLSLIIILVSGLFIGMVTHMIYGL